MTNLLDILFPKRCVSCGKFGAYFCPKCNAKIQYLENQFCPECTRPSIAGATHPSCQRKYTLDGILSAFYFSGPAKAAIHKLKYKLISDLADELVEIALSNQEFTTILHNIVIKDFILIPVPLHRRRENWRGFNQAKALAEKIAKEFDFPFNDQILKRVKDTLPQVDLKREDRAENVSNAFQFSSKREVSGKKFLLFDDVATTGATLKACAYVLKKAGAPSVWALTLARQSSQLSRRSKVAN